MSTELAQNILSLKCILQNIKIKICDRIENGVKQLLALVTSDGDIVLHYTYGEMHPLVKRVPWFSDRLKQIKAICFDPSASWLLVTTVDGSLYIIPALSLIDQKQKIDCKWSLTDVTSFPRPTLITPSVEPTSIIWWQTIDCNQNALVGYANGEVALVSLTDGRCLGCCSVMKSIKKFSICHDDYFDYYYLLINAENGKQWQLLLEHRSSGYLWPVDNSGSENTPKTRFDNLKQLGVEKLQFFKQKLTEATFIKKSESTSESSSTCEVIVLHPLPYILNVFFAPLYARNQYLFSAFYKPNGLLTIQTELDSAPLLIYKLCSDTDSLLYTDKLIFAINDNSDKISVLSTCLCQCNLDIQNDSTFKPESLICQFNIKNEKILQIYKMVDLSSARLRKKDENKPFQTSMYLKDPNMKKPRIDTCVIITDNSVYKLVVSNCPINSCIKYVTEYNDLESAEKLSRIFGLNLQQLFEYCADILIFDSCYHSGITLYKQAKVHILKRVLKLAVAADCKTLLKFVHICLRSSKVDMSMATKIHIGNLAVMAYIELILRYGPPFRIRHTKDFMNFLCHEEYYDQILAVNVACQAGQWNIVNLLAKARGLQPEVVSALSQILQSARAPRPRDKEFLMALSEPCLTQSLILHTENSQVIFQYIRDNVDQFPLHILKRLAVQLDPSQPSTIPLVSRIFQNSKKYSSGLDTTNESIDIGNPDNAVLTVKDIIETFLVVIISLSWKIDKKYDLKFLDKIDPPEDVDYDLPIKHLPSLNPLSCGYEHTAVIRNNCVYTMGGANSGCLGLGPLLSQSTHPKLVETLSDLKVKVLSVSCGRKHTFALTDFGIYAWGSNSYGQLGLGKLIHESPYPQIVHSLCEEKVIDISAGQYHSIALTSSGKVYTWGWGIYGQLGHGIVDNEYYPRLLGFDTPVKQVSAGYSHSLILTCTGQLYGFGSNYFGQLAQAEGETNKSTRPILICIGESILKIGTSYFHNMAIGAKREVYFWGANPQEVRLFNSKNQKKSGKPSEESWKTNVGVFPGERSIEQLALGYRHSAWLLKNGEIQWGKYEDCNLNSLKFVEQSLNSAFPQRYLAVSCGFDYTMAIDQSGKLLGWGNSSMAQTLLGKPEENNKYSDGKVAIFKNTRRIIKLSNSVENFIGSSPVQIPVPSLVITFNCNDHKLLLSKKFIPYAICKIENEIELPTKSKKIFSPLDDIQESPNLIYGFKTLHYALQAYYGLYDTEKILSRCFNIGNYQAASKVALLDGHYGDSLGFQLMALKEHIKTLNLNLHSIFNEHDVKKNEKFVIRNIQDDLNEKNLLHSNSNEKILNCSRITSSSSSLDSIRQWGDDIEHQGGRESPCEMSEISDIRQNMTQYVQSVTTSNENSPSIVSVCKLTEENGKKSYKSKTNVTENSNDDVFANTIIEMASVLVEFYITKVYVTENHILMQNVLLKSIEFWLTNNLPVPILEDVLLKNMEKYFYPLSILLFCKNFGSNDEEIIKESDTKNSACFLKEFSTKFCLQLCSMVLENVNKS